MRELGVEGEDVWQTLRQHAEWAEGVWFAWIFVAAPAEIDELIHRLDDVPSARAPSLVIPLDTPEAAIEMLFSLKATDRRAVWVVGQGTDLRQWERLHLLLNERRERLRRHLAGALVFVGRPEWKEPTRAAAPDLWSQRTVVLEWSPIGQPTQEREALSFPRTPDPAPDAALAARGLRRAQDRGDVAAEAASLVELATAKRLGGHPREAHALATQAAHRAPRGELRARALAAVAEAEEALGDVSGAAVHYRAALEEPGGPLGDEAAGWACAEGGVLLEAGRVAEARRAYTRGLSLAQGPSARGEALYGAGRCAEVLGEPGTALALLSRALELAVGLGPDARRQRMVLLAELGRIRGSLGDLEAARIDLQRALAIARDSPDGVEDPGEARRDLIATLQRLRWLETARGDLAAARAIAEEILELARRLYDQRPGLDELRGVARATVSLGDAETEADNLSGAEAAYVNAVAMLRTVHAEQGTVPAVLTDLAGALRRLGMTAFSLGNHEAAIKSVAEALALERRVVSAGGEESLPAAELIRTLGALITLSPTPALVAEARARAEALVARWPLPEYVKLKRWIDDLDESKPPSRPSGSRRSPGDGRGNPRR